jgi:DeoR family transcriptional regulator, fructose operon transcriptional repressor
MWQADRNGGVGVNLEGLERLERIRHRLDTGGSVRVADLAAEHGVSEMTIRRDLDVLVSNGAARRVRGGAVAVGTQRFVERYGHQAKAKSRIAEKAMTLVGTGGAIGLDASTTLQRLAAGLGGVGDLTVLTNGPDTFQSLQSQDGVTALLTGGELDESTGNLVGPLAVRAAGQLLLRRLFLSAAAFDAELGSSEASLADADVKLAMAAAASEVVLAIDSSKLGHRSAARCIPIERISFLITELDPADHRLDPYRERTQVL